MAAGRSRNYVVKRSVSSWIGSTNAPSRTTGRKGNGVRNRCLPSAGEKVSRCLPSDRRERFLTPFLGPGPRPRSPQADHLPEEPCPASSRPGPNRRGPRAGGRSQGRPRPTAAGRRDVNSPTGSPAAGSPQCTALPDGADTPASSPAGTRPNGIGGGVRSQTRTVRSTLHEARYRPPGWNATRIIVFS